MMDKEQKKTISRLDRLCSKMEEEIKVIDKLSKESETRYLYYKGINQTLSSSKLNDPKEW